MSEGVNEMMSPEESTDAEGRTMQRCVTCRVGARHGVSICIVSLYFLSVPCALGVSTLQEVVSRFHEKQMERWM